MAAEPPAQCVIRVLGIDVEHRVVTNWNEAEDNELRVALEEHPVFAHGRFSGPQGLPRAHDADHVCDVESARHVRGDPGCSVSLCFKTEDGVSCCVLVTVCRSHAPFTKVTCFLKIWLAGDLTVCLMKVFTESGCTLSRPPERG